MRRNKPSIVWIFACAGTMEFEDALFVRRANIYCGNDQIFLRSACASSSAIRNRSLAPFEKRY